MLARMKIPFGIAQTGKAFRNEIVARQFVFRMREFEQMEMQFFIRPGDQMEWFDYWKKTRMNWHLALGSDAGDLRLLRLSPGALSLFLSGRVSESFSYST